MEIFGLNGDFDKEIDKGKLIIKMFLIKVILIKKIMQLNVLNKEKDKWIFWNYKLDNK